MSELITIEFIQAQRYEIHVSRDTWGQIVHEVDPDLDPDDQFSVSMALLNLQPASDAARALHLELEDAHAAEGHPDALGVHTQVIRIDNPHRIRR